MKHSWLLILFITITVPSESAPREELKSLLKLRGVKAFEYATKENDTYKYGLSPKVEIGNLLVVVETSARMRAPNTFRIREEALLALVRACVRSKNYHTLTLFDGDGKEYFSWKRSEYPFDEAIVNHIINIFRLNPFESESVLPGIQAAVKKSTNSSIPGLHDFIYVIGDSLTANDIDIIDTIEEIKLKDRFYFDFYSMNTFYRHEYSKLIEKEAFNDKSYRKYRVVMKYLQERSLQVAKEKAKQ